MKHGLPEWPLWATLLNLAIAAFPALLLLALYSGWLGAPH
jgi:hypothetical protein